MGKQFVQGDVMFIRFCDGQTPSPPRHRLEPENGLLVLARGEKTGHVHAVDASVAEAYALDWQTLYMNVREPVEVKHDEHAPLALEPGGYEVRMQRRYTPAQDARVVD